MTLVIEEVTDAPIIIIIIKPPVDITTEPTQTSNAALDFLQKKGGCTVARIMDYTQVKLTFGDVALGMSADVAFQNPNIKTIIVGTDALVKMAAEAFKQDKYGKVDVPVFASMDEAIAAARQIFE